MGKSKVVLGFKKPIDFTKVERRQIIEEYLEGGKSKQEIWKKHTGLQEEHGGLLRWMRELGFVELNNSPILEATNLLNMRKSKDQYSTENLQLQKKIEDLEKALVNSELRALAFETMIDVAEKELKISIKKKSFTKQSTK